MKRRNPFWGAVVLALAVAVGLLMPAGAANAQPPLLPVHYVVYEAPAMLPVLPPPVDLLTDFGLEEDVELGPGWQLAAPALKNGGGYLQVPHLRFFPMNEPAPSPTRYVTVTDQFGSYENLEIGPAFALGVPTIKYPVSPPLPPTPMYEDWHYKCYSVGPRPAGEVVTIMTQFHMYGPGPEPVYVYNLGGLCLPAGKNGAPIPDAPYLTMYDIAPSWAPGWLVILEHQFGSENVMVNVGVHLLEAAEVVEVLPTAPHYACYFAPPTIQLLIPPVTLLTQFGPEYDVAVSNPHWFCPPALKNGEGDLTAPHLRSFSINEPPPEPERVVNLTTQFGSYEDVVVGPAFQLLVPASKEVIYPMQVPPTPLEPDDPHYKCYLIQVPDVEHVATVYTQFQQLLGAPPVQANVGPPVALCAPAEKNYELGGEIPATPDLVCYAAGFPPPVMPFVVNLLHQFGMEPFIQLVFPGELLCMPALKTEADDGINDRPEDDFIAAPKGSAESGESVDYDDNCPGVYNPDQTNTDGLRRPNGSQIPGAWASNPKQDIPGDLCDSDDDNDWMLDIGTHPVTGVPGEYVGCGSGPTNPLVADTDGDTVTDGAECALGSNPNDPTSLPPLPVPDMDKDGLPAWLDNLLCPSDVDGDGLVGDNDPDCDSPTSVVEFNDGVEFKGYGTHPAIGDTDGDMCADWIEIVDVNGNRSANIVDVLLIAQRAFNIIPASDSDYVFDINKSGAVNIVDVLLAVRNSSLVRGSAATCTTGEE
jgi:hypothetical protein